MLYTTGVIGVWPDNIDCSLFRNLTLVKMFFIIVPENFTYCCEDGVSALSLVNFTYGKNKGPLDPRPYFDLGIVDNFQPYWKYWNFWHVDTTNSVFNLHCDHVDMHQQYVRRLSTPTLRNGARYGGEILGILMGAVWSLALCRWLLWKLIKCLGQPQQANPGGQPQQAIWMRPICWIWGRIWMRGWADLFHDFIHLMLLALIGSCMMEAVGHSNVRLWRASVMFNTGVLYTYLTLFVLVSSVLRQLSTSWISFDLILDLSSQNVLGDEIQIMRRDVWVALNDAIKNWRWTAVFGQTAVLVSMANYLTLVDDDSGSSMDGVAGIVLTAVAAASTWSFGMATVVLIYAVLFAILDTFCRMSPCWTSAWDSITGSCKSAWDSIARGVRITWNVIIRPSPWAFIGSPAAIWAFFVRRRTQANGRILGQIHGAQHTA
ncbi:unnamed protein product [Sphagnum jensenii]|uniref:Transmembrane protein n=1 Tax=Sphagnum jensenii TaxID=128206 RepID=A0ABP1AP24_9BRYO